MRQFFRHLILLCLVVALLPAAVALPVTAQTEAVPDDELVLINRDGRIVVNDPYTPPGYQKLTWESPQTGFGQVVTGDFNGDGTDEIVGLRGGEAIVYDPYRQPGESDVATSFTAAPAGQTWRLAVTGNFYGNNRDGLVLLQTLNQGSLKARMRSFFFDPVSGWTSNWSEDFGALFVGLAAGNVDGDNRDELAGIRAVTGSNLIIIWKPTPSWTRIFEGNYGYPWVAIAIGDVVEDTLNKDEIITTRSGVGSNLNSYLVFRWVNSSSALQDVVGDKYNPYFRWIALADVTGNGDDEIYLLRPGSSGGVSIVALTSRNYGDDGGSVIQFNELSGQTRFGNIHGGDVDGDGRDELILMSADEYIIYTEPATSTSYTSYVGAFSTGLSFAVGNLDGNGILQGPQLSVTPTTVNLTVQAGQVGTQAIQISNSGTGTLTWTSTVTQGANWLSIQPTGGTAPTAATLQLDARNLVAGAYTGTVRISGQAGAANSPVDVTVNLTVTTPPSPRLTVTPTEISLNIQSGQTATQSVQITNTGPGTLNWTASLVQGAPWLSFSPSSGTAPSTLTLNINAVNVQPGQYTGTVRIAGASGVLNSPQDVTVNLTVTAPPAPRLSVTPTAIVLSVESGQSTTRPVQIANTGAGTLNWTAALVQGAPWLSFSPSSGTAPSTLTLSMNAVNVQPGQYTGIIRVTAATGVLNSPQDITVTLTVTAPPFFVTPTAVTWTYIPPTPPGTRTVTVNGTGISWHAGVVPMDRLQRIQDAIAAGRLMAINNGFLALGDGGEDVPIVDYIDVSPSSSTANQTGVTLSLIPANVPYGFNQAAVVFVADGVASPPAVVVRTSVLRTQPDASDLFYVPLIVAGQ